jgi:hypothetical protein
VLDDQTLESASTFRACAEHPSDSAVAVAGGELDLAREFELVERPVS